MSTLERQSTSSELATAKREPYSGLLYATVGNYMAIPVIIPVGVFGSAGLYSLMGVPGAVVGMVLSAAAFIGLGTYSVKGINYKIDRDNKRMLAALENLTQGSGIELTEDEFRELKYPAQPLEEGYRVFGSIDKFLPGSEGMELRRITLVSSAGELKLVSSRLNAREHSAIEA